MQTNNEPYVGPRPFEESDRDVFFGREQEANELVSLITAHRVVLLYAQSGSGKTSLVKAGLIPLLVHEEKFDVLPPLRVRGQIAAGSALPDIKNIYLFNALMGVSSSTAFATQPGWQRVGQMPLTGFLQERKQTNNQGGLDTPTVVIFDQFEEIFTLYPERWEERQQFFEQIRDALNVDPLLRVLFSMREDFIAELDPYVSCLPEKLRTRFRIERLNRRTALLTVTRPLEAISSANGGTRFAPGVAEELIDNLLLIKVKIADGVREVKGKFIEPLQLQVVCQTLWRNLKRGDSLITQEHLRAFGDVDKALSSFYENAIQKTVQHTGVKTGALRRWCEQKLITPAGTRGTVFRGETQTGDLKNEAVVELERQHLIRMELRGGAPWYELTHDRFVEIIQDSNRKWLLALPGAEQILLRLEEKAASWDEDDREDNNLLDQVELLEAQHWLKSPEAVEFEPSKRLVALVRESEKAIQSKTQLQIEQQRIVAQRAKTARVFRWLSIALFILFLAALGASGYAVRLWVQTRAERDKSQKAYNDLASAQKEITQAHQTIDIKQGQNDAMVEAENLLNADKLDEAKTAFENLIKNFPEQDPTYANLEIADICQRTHQFKKAIDYYDRALIKWCAPTPVDNNQCFVLARNPPADKNPFFKYYVGATIIKKGQVQLDWGEDDEENGRKDSALKRYGWASGYFRQAAQLFKKGDAGFDEAADGLKKVAAANARLTASQEPAPSPQR